MMLAVAVVLSACALGAAFRPHGYPSINHPHPVSTSSRLLSALDEIRADTPVMLLPPSGATGTPAGGSDLPNDFKDAVFRASRQTYEFIKSGGTRCRVEFDTSVGDMTFTTIKNAAPVLKEMSKFLAELADLSRPVVTPTPPELEGLDLELFQNATKLANAQMEVTRSLRIFYPDMGVAAMTRRDWKLGTAEAEVPPCVFTANIMNDNLAPTDKLVIIACPLYSEVDAVKRILDMCEANSVPCIMLNPQLINMDQGFGVRARNLRKGLLDSFTTTYKLKTLREGAVVREHPLLFTVWKEEATQQDGYRALGTSVTDPTFEEIDNLMEGITAEEAANGGNPVLGAINEVVSFFQGMSKL
mmetsp:Transcript_15273/g.33708  ORF Transcript_15273/g.33708 Transcript_15273/m.33708 type:complete len:358 (-) Transcript_15273:144-1217(-)|eukprot:CAMPEP_0173173912 /NCGR_PEP_ID=MMETSP1141-20130122/3078_1 /TAXON_ID=483371 /ORGANISM="non described non described, Strain CCMP2298" /LENGTH=357 /DNA_ID=CAMNT_0014096013 /DNA_START=42 /DNA_END=1115 /DNA_ORIENTATION=+